MIREEKTCRLSMATQRENSLFLFFLCIIYYIIDTDTRNLDRLVARAHNGKDNDSKEKK